MTLPLGPHNICFLKKKKSISEIFPSEGWDGFKITLTLTSDHQSVIISSLGQSEYLGQILGNSVKAFLGYCVYKNGMCVNNLKTGDGTKQSTIRLITCDNHETMIPFFIETRSDPPPSVSCVLSFSGFRMTCRRSFVWFVRANEREGQKSVCLGGETVTQRHSVSARDPENIPHNTLTWGDSQHKHKHSQQCLHTHTLRCKEKVAQRPRNTKNYQLAYWPSYRHEETYINLISLFIINVIHVPS